MGFNSGFKGLKSVLYVEKGQIRRRTENVEFPCYKNYFASDGQGFACFLIICFSLWNCERQIFCHFSQPFFASSHVSYLLGAEPKFLLPSSCASDSKLKAKQQSDKPVNRYHGRRWCFAWKLNWKTT